MMLMRATQHPEYIFWNQVGLNQTRFLLVDDWWLLRHE